MNQRQLKIANEFIDTLNMEGIYNPKLANIPLGLWQAIISTAGSALEEAFKDDDCRAEDAARSRDQAQPGGESTE